MQRLRVTQNPIFGFGIVERMPSVNDSDFLKIVLNLSVQYVLTNAYWCTCADMCAV